MTSEKEGSLLSLALRRMRLLFPIQDGVAQHAHTISILRLSFSTSPGEEGTRVTRYACR
jgi:hypothetical protein